MPSKRATGARCCRRSSRLCRSSTREELARGIRQHALQSAGRRDHAMTATPAPGIPPRRARLPCRAPPRRGRSTPVHAQGACRRPCPRWVSRYPHSASRATTLDQVMARDAVSPAHGGDRLPLTGVQGQRDQRAQAEVGVARELHFRPARRRRSRPAARHTPPRARPPNTSTRWFRPFSAKASINPPRCTSPGIEGTEHHAAHARVHDGRRAHQAGAPASRRARCRRGR